MACATSDFVQFSLQCRWKMSQDLKFSSRIQSVEVGEAIIISGKATPAARRMNFDLSSDSDENIPFHMSVRVDEGIVVRNSYTKRRGWEKEERQENLIKSNASSLVKQNENFIISIYIDSSEFVVSINDKPFCTFSYRKPLSEIQKLSIWNDVEKVYRVDHVTTPPSCWPPLNIHNTFGSLFPKPLQAGNIIVVTATPRAVGHFNINLLQTQPSRSLFHFQTNMKNSIMMNDQLDNLSWRGEVKPNLSPFPFEVYRTFKLAIAFTNFSLLLAIDGKLLARFDYREDKASLFEWIQELEISSCENANLEIKSVDHMLITPNCNNFKSFSK